MTSITTLPINVPENKLLKELFDNSEYKNFGVVRSYNDLKSMFGLNSVKGSTREGSSNRVERFVSKGITIRLSKHPSIYEISKTNMITAHADDDDIEEDIQTKNNWLQADKLEVCPKIYFYGYVIGDKDNDVELYHVMVGALYQSDLNEYYNEGPGRNLKHYGDDAYFDPKNTIIAKQLIDKLTIMATKMQLICFDIKPLNAVINDRGGNDVDVRLIDWDGDWCVDYSKILKQKTQ